MGKRQDIEFVRKFREKLSDLINLRKLILFGSRISGNVSEDSDFDLVIVSDDFKGKDLIERGKGLHKGWGYDYPVDFLCYTEEEFERLKNRPTIVREAVEQGVEI